MRELMVAGNWKMNNTIDEARGLVIRLMPGLKGIDGVTMVLCPPFVALESVGLLVQDSGVAVGAQDMYHEANGAFTGEVSAKMLAGVCEFVIVGHSERRSIFGETDASVGRKVAAALEAGMRPIMCVGEKLDERQAGAAEDVVDRQVRLALEGTAAPDGLVVAYEPVWAIGTGMAATPQDAQSMLAHIRRLLSARYGEGTTTGIPLLYGGSVTDENVAGFARQPDVDGALVGGASLKADSFVGIVRTVAEVGQG